MSAQTDKERVIAELVAKEIPTTDLSIGAIPAYRLGLAAYDSGYSAAIEDAAKACDERVNSNIAKDIAAEIRAVKSALEPEKP